MPDYSIRDYLEVANGGASDTIKLCKAGLHSAPPPPSRARHAAPARARRRRPPPRSRLIADRSLRAVCLDGGVGNYGCTRDCTNLGGYATDCRTFKHNPCTEDQYLQWSQMTKDMGFSDFRAEDVNWNKPIAWRGSGGCTLDNQGGCILGIEGGCVASPAASGGAPYPHLDVPPHRHRSPLPPSSPRPRRPPRARAPAA